MTWNGNDTSPKMPCRPPLRSSGVNILAYDVLRKKGLKAPRGACEEWYIITSQNANAQQCQNANEQDALDHVNGVYGPFGINNLHPINIGNAWHQRPGEEHDVTGEEL